MNKIFMLIPAAALSLSACVTTSGGGLIDQVRSIALTVCSFVPTAETIAAILAKNSPGLTTASQVANAICAAVTMPAPSPGLSARPAAATVTGVKIDGEFVR